MTGHTETKLYRTQVGERMDIRTLAKHAAKYYINRDPYLEDEASIIAYYQDWYRIPQYRMADFTYFMRGYVNELAGWAGC